MKLLLVPKELVVKFDIDINKNKVNNWIKDFEQENCECNDIFKEGLSRFGWNDFLKYVDGWNLEPLLMVNYHVFLSLNMIWERIFVFIIILTMLCIFFKMLKLLRRYVYEILKCFLRHYWWRRFDGFPVTLETTELMKVN